MENEKLRTVSYLYQNNKKKPYIRILGKWLEEHNFHVNDKFKIYGGKDILLLVKEK